MTRADRLRQGTIEDRITALQEIGATAPATPDELDIVIECLSDARKAVQRGAAEAASRCARFAPPVVDRLQHAVANGPWRQRWGAAFALSLLGLVPGSALATLLEALDSDDGDVRWAAADLVKQLARRDASTVTAVLLRAARAGAANQRKMSLYILRDLGWQEGAAAALAALHAEPTAVRLAALAALVALAPDRANAAEHVVPLVRDADERMRRAAAAALGHLEVATDEVCAVLEEAAATDDPALRRAADRALQALRARAKP